MQTICIWSSLCHCHPIISCLSKTLNGLTFLVPAYPGCPGKQAVKRVSVCLSAVASNGKIQLLTLKSQTKYSLPLTAMSDGSRM